MMDSVTQYALGEGDPQPFEVPCTAGSQLIHWGNPPLPSFLPSLPHFLTPTRRFWVTLPKQRLVHL